MADGRFRGRMGIFGAILLLYFLQYSMKCLVFRKFYLESEIRSPKPSASLKSVSRMRGGAAGAGLPGSPFATISAEDLFCRVFAGVTGTEGSNDGLNYLLLDIRDSAKFLKAHIAGSFNLRWSWQTKQFVDDAHMKIGTGWRKGMHKGKRVVIIHDEGTYPSNRKAWLQNMVYKILYNAQECISLEVLDGGIQEFQEAFPFLVTTSRYENPRGEYPTPIMNNQLYLGTWRQAHFEKTYQDLRIRKVICIGAVKAEIPNVAHINKGHHFQIDPDGSSVRDEKYPGIEIRRSLRFAVKIITDAIERKQPVLIYSAPLREMARAGDAAEIAEMAGTVSESTGVSVPGIGEKSPLESASAGIVMLLVMSMFKFSPAKAYKFIHSRRPTIAPSLIIWKALFEEANEMRIVEDPKDMFPPQLHKMLLRSVHEQDSAQFGAEHRVDSTTSRGQAFLGVKSEGNILAPKGLEKDSFVLPPPQSSIWFEVTYHGSRTPAQIPLQKGAILNVGRKNGSDIRPPHMSVSRNHSTIYIDASGRIAVMDQGSPHGTFINFRRLTPFQPEMLRTSDRIRFGGLGSPFYRLGSISEREVKDRIQNYELKQEVGQRRKLRQREIEEGVAEANAEKKAEDALRKARIKQMRDEEKARKLARF